MSLYARLAAAGVVLLLVFAGGWRLGVRLTQGRWDAAERERLTQQAVLEARAEKAEAEAARLRQAQRATSAKASSARTERVIHATATDPVFADCRVPDGVRDDLAAAIDQANAAR